MNVLILLCVLMPTVLCVLPPPEYVNCDNTREAVLECAGFLFDLDKDNQITMDELNQVIPTLVSMPAPDMDASYFMKCDMDEDNILTMDDWNHPNSTCLPTPNCIYVACLVCTRNGFQMTHPSSEDEEGRRAYDYDAIVKFAKDNADKIKEAREKREALKKDMIKKMHNKYPSHHASHAATDPHINPPPPSMGSKNKHLG